MKKCTLLILITILSLKAFTQGWVGNSANNVLYSVSSTLGLSPLSVGIGTNAPTAQFHTTGSVRFAGLNNADNPLRIVVSDANGNLSYANTATLIPPPGPNKDWLLSGNPGTIPGTGGGQNYLGTTDPTRLVFATNAAEKMTILPGGNVGIGTSAPKTLLHVVGGTTGTMAFPYEKFVVENNGDLKLGIYTTVKTPSQGGASLTLGYSNYQQADGTYPGYEMQYGINPSNVPFLRFNTLNRNAAGTVVNSSSNNMVLDNQGRVGINLGPTSGTPAMPTANLHVNGTVRFASLNSVNNPLRIIVSDALGNLSYANTATLIPPPGPNNDWLLSGNTGTIPGTGAGQNYLGTTDPTRLVFATNAAEKMTILSNGNIGVGTSAPTAQFHTTGSVRFAGLNNAANPLRIVVSDANGNLSYANTATLIPPPAPNNNWLLSGNAGTIAGTGTGQNYLGTTDPTRLVFATDAVEKMTVLSNGNVGIGTSTPKTLLHVVGGTTGTMAFPYEKFVVENNGDLKLGIYTTVATPSQGGASLTLGYSNYQINGAYPGYEMQYGINPSNVPFLRFNTLQRNAAGTVVTSNSNNMVLDDQGHVGINLGPTSGTPTMPTANLHVNGTVRFQNLPTGAGTPLVIDVNGNVYEQTVAAARPATTDQASTTDIATLTQQLQQTQQELTDLKNQFNELYNAVTANNVTVNAPAQTNMSSLIGNFPNPAANNTIIKYTLASTVTSASILIYNNTGTLVQSYNLAAVRGQNQVQVDTQELANSTYTYTLVINGQVTDSKQMVVVN